MSGLQAGGVTAAEVAPKASERQPSRRAVWLAPALGPTAPRATGTDTTDTTVVPRRQPVAGVDVPRL